MFGERSYIRDNDSEKLEDRLGDILVTLYEKAEENRSVREAREEIRLVKELVNKAEDYRIAKEIREYIQAMIDSGNEDITPEWIEWALKKRKNLCKTVSERAGIGKNEWRQFDG